MKCLDLGYNLISEDHLLTLSADLEAASERLGRRYLDSLDLSGNPIALHKKDALIQSFAKGVGKVDLLVLDFTNILADHVGQM